jgi:uncharacterized tellurite resistance protein B-like protein
LPLLGAAPHATLLPARADMLRWLIDQVSLASPDKGTALGRAVREQLAGTDEESARIVAAIAGLLGTVAYADRNYAPVEEERIREQLGRVRGLTASGVDSICRVLREHIVDISTIEAPVYARELLDLADRELRLEVLDALVDLAAADDEITVSETNVLRLTATALGLTQSDYNASQSRYREKLKVLQK